jgi:protein-tyrosine-phosphatase
MKSIVFLCQHGAAKSILAAAYFQHLAAQRGLPFRAASAGLAPDPAIPSAVIALLQSEGLPIPAEMPRLATEVELSAATRVVSLGCALGGRVPPEALIDWSDVPPFSEDARAAQASIWAHVERLVAELAEAAV